MNNDSIDKIQLASNEVILQLIKELKNKTKMYKTALLALIISQTLIVMSVFAFAAYTLSNYNIETYTEEVTIEGEEAYYNKIKGNGNTINNTKEVN